MVRVSTSRSVDMILIHMSNHTKELKNDFRSSLVVAHNERYFVEEKPENLLVLYLGRAFNLILSCLCTKQLVKTGVLNHAQLDNCNCE